MFELLVVTFMFAWCEPERSLDQQLIVACHKVDVDGVVKCLRKGANINAKYRHGAPASALADPAFSDPWIVDFPPWFNCEWTPLLALVNSHEFPDPSKSEMVRKDPALSLILRKQIPKSIIDNRRADEITILQILLSHGCNLEDEADSTAIYFASRAGRVELAKLLLKAGANPNVKDTITRNGVDSRSPLHVGFKFPEMRKLLLEFGADANAVDSIGRKPGAD
jgi:ankyrin repeat protein